MNMKRILSLGLSLVLVLALAACGSTPPPATDSSGSSAAGAPEASAAAVTGTVALEGPGVSYSGAVTLEGDAPTASEAFIAFCQQQKLAYKYKDGFFSAFADVASAADEGWLFYVGDDLAQVGADDIPLADGFAVSFRWMNYDEAFAE